MNILINIFAGIGVFSTVYWLVGIWITLTDKKKPLPFNALPEDYGK